jgi:hypothetical protein
MADLCLLSRGLIADRSPRHTDGTVDSCSSLTTCSIRVGHPFEPRRPPRRDRSVELTGRHVAYHPLLSSWPAFVIESASTRSTQPAVVSAGTAPEVACSVPP